MDIKLPQFEFNLTDKQEVVDGTFELSFKSQSNFLFEAGQYIWVLVNDSRRAFSIINSPNTNSEIKILFRKGESNYKKDLLQLKIKDKVNILGPFGRSFRFPKDTKSLVLIGGGVGVGAGVGVEQTPQSAGQLLHVSAWEL